MTMSCARWLTMSVLVVVLAGLVSAQAADSIAVGLREVRQAMHWPDTLQIRVTGLFQSPEDGRIAMITWAPLEDDSVLDRWCLIEGARYEYVVSLRSDGDWLLRSLSCGFMAEEPATTLAPAPTPELTLQGAFIATREGRLLPDFSWEGEGVRDCTVRLLVATMPPRTTVIEIERTEPAVRVLYRADPWDFDWNWHWPPLQARSYPHFGYRDPFAPGYERPEHRRFTTVRPRPRREERPSRGFITLPTPSPRDDQEKPGDDTARKPDPPRDDRSQQRRPAFYRRGAP